MGITPMRYVAYRRVERSKLLLTETDDPLAGIAYSCGFASQAHFCTLFKSFTGMTPGLWRRRNR